MKINYKIKSKIIVFLIINLDRIMDIKRKGFKMFKVIIFKFVGLSILLSFVFQLNSGNFNSMLLVQLAIVYVLFKLFTYSSVFIFKNKKDIKNISKITLH